MNRLRSRWLLAALAFLLGNGFAAADQGEKEYRFQVLLEDDPIGFQVFRVRNEDARTTIAIEAQMDVKILFFTAYTYRHTNQEVWEEGCLASMDSQTNDNGEPFRVRGRRQDEGFVVETALARTVLPGCVHSFAYWDLGALRASQLLNSQTGEHENVTLRELGEETREWRGRQLRAHRVALEGPALRIDLWYSADAAADWLALESKSKSGRIIRYLRE